MFEQPEETPTPAEDGMEASDPTVVDLDEALRPHTTPKRRAAQVGAMLAVLIVVVGVLLHGIAPAQQGAASVLPTIAFVPPTIVVASNVNFGTVTVNGRTLKGTPPAIAHFRFGDNVVTLSAPPFRPRSCTIDWPSGQSVPGSGCGTGSGGQVTINGASIAPDLIVFLDLDSTYLSSDLAAGAYATAAQAIAAVRLHTVVPTGQYYATGLDGQEHITSRRASTALQAEAVFGPVDSQTSDGPVICSPSGLCTGPRFPDVQLPPNWRVWFVGLAITVRWRFTPPAGQAMLSPAQPLTTPIPVLLAYDGVGGWSVVSQLPEVTTEPGLAAPLPDELVSFLCDAGFSAGSYLIEQNGDGFSSLHDQGIEGCEIQVTTSSNSPLGVLVWRFGVLLAADRGAHALAPWLPVAPQAEIAAVGG